MLRHSRYRDRPGHGQWHPPNYNMDQRNYQPQAQVSVAPQAHAHHPGLLPHPSLSPNHQPQQPTSTGHTQPMQNLAPSVVAPQNYVFDISQGINSFTVSLTPTPPLCTTSAGTAPMHLHSPPPSHFTTCSVPPHPNYSNSGGLNGLNLNSTGNAIPSFSCGCCFHHLTNANSQHVATTHQINQQHYPFTHSHSPSGATPHNYFNIGARFQSQPQQGGPPHLINRPQTVPSPYSNIGQPIGMGGPQQRVPFSSIQFNNGVQFNNNAQSPATPQSPPNSNGEGINEHPLDRRSINIYGALTPPSGHFGAHHQHQHHPPPPPHMVVPPPLNQHGNPMASSPATMHHQVQDHGLTMAAQTDFFCMVLISKYLSSLFL